MLFWLHLVATGLFLGTTAGLALFTVPRARGVPELEGRRSVLTRTFKVYDPLAIGLLGVMVMTGAWSITGYKQALGASYFASFGAHLAWKLGLAFLVVLCGTYIAFGLGHRLVRQEEWGEAPDERRLASLLRRLGATAWLTVGLTVATIAVAVQR